MNTEYEFFFNNMKKEMSNINYHLNEIINIYDSLINNIENLSKDTQEKSEENEEGKTLLKIKFIEDINHYKLKLDEMTDFKNNINIMIQENCAHNYIFDTIDSGLDKSTNIEYCDICYKVKE